MVARDGGASVTTIQAFCVAILAALMVGAAVYSFLLWRATGLDLRAHLEATARTHRIDPTGLPNGVVAMMIRDGIEGWRPTAGRLSERIARALDLPSAAVTIGRILRNGEVLVTVRFPWWRLRRAKWLEVARGVAERYSPAWTVVLVEAAK